MAEETLDLDRLSADIARAHEEVDGLCRGKRRWRMTIPAKVTDSDLTISTGLMAAESLLAEARHRRSGHQLFVDEDGGRWHPDPDAWPLRGFPADLETFKRALAAEREAGRQQEREEIVRAIQADLDALVAREGQETR